MRVEFNNLVNTLKRYDLYQIGDEVDMDLKSLENKITEVEKRIECIDKTAEEIRQSISKYTKRVDKTESFIMLVNDHDTIQRGANDILTATDLEDDEVVINNWYGLFESKEDKVGKFFKVISNTHKELEGRTFKITDTAINEVGHLIGEIDCRHPEESEVWVWVNLELDGEYVDEPTKKPMSVSEYVSSLGIQVEPTEDKVELSSGGMPYRVCYHCSIKEEEIVMTKVNGNWLCNDCNPPTSQCHDEEVHNIVKDVIAKLKDIQVDGETMDYIVKELGFEEYLLRSLVMKSSFKETKDLLREKFEISI